MLRNWDPFQEISRFQDEMNRRYVPRTGKAVAFRPSVDIFEDDEAIVLTAEVAGVKPDDIHVSIENHVLTVQGERKLEKEEKREGYHRIERSYGSFMRSFSLPDSVDTDTIAAEKKDGVLKLKIMKKAKPQPRRIDVRGED